MGGTPFAGCDLIISEQNHLPEGRLLRTLQELLALPALELTEALMAAAQRISETLGCDKVDAFMLDEHKQTLRAIGTSDTPMGRRQRELGLDVLAIANGGRAVETFKTGITFLNGHTEEDAEEVRGVVTELGVRSSLIVAFDVDGVRRGVLSAVSAQSEFFQANDRVFFEAVGRWIGMLVHRAELAELARNAESERARRTGADEIITVLAHDLRNHLHPLLSRLHVIRIHAAGGRVVEAAEIDGAIRSVQRIARLANDLLDLKRLDEGLFSLDLVPIDLHAVAAETAAGLSTSSVPVSVTGLAELVIIADADRVRQALENLVANAVKYSPRGKAVQIHVSVEGKDENVRAVLDVIDAGPGISPEIMPRLFDRFVSSPDSPGLGLGLYLAHRIARVHRGNLSVHSELGVGTRFRLELPMHAPADTALDGEDED